MKLRAGLLMTTLLLAGCAGTAQPGAGEHVHYSDAAAAQQQAAEVQNESGAPSQAVVPEPATTPSR